MSTGQTSTVVAEDVLAIARQHDALRQRFELARPEPQWSYDMVDYKHMARLLDISRPSEVLSHRPVLGPAIIWTKRFAMKVARPLIKVLLRRQIELNEYLYHSALMTETLLAQVRRLEAQVQELKQQQTGQEPPQAPRENHELR